MSIPLPERSSRYSQNINRCCDNEACLLCGKAIRNDRLGRVAWLHLHGGGNLVVTDEEAKALGRDGDLSFFPIGPECLRTHPELKPYIRRIATSLLDVFP